MTYDEAMIRLLNWEICNGTVHVRRFYSAKILLLATGLLETTVRSQSGVTSFVAYGYTKFRAFARCHGEKFE